MNLLLFLCSIIITVFSHSQLVCLFLFSHVIFCPNIGPEEVQPSLVNTDVCSDNYNTTMAINITWVWTRLASANHCQHSEAKYIFTQLLDIFRSMIQMFFSNNNSLNISNYFKLKFQTLYVVIYCVLELNKDKYYF